MTLRVLQACQDDPLRRLAALTLVAVLALPVLGPAAPAAAQTAAEEPTASEPMAEEAMAEEAMAEEAMAEPADPGARPIAVRTLSTGIPAAPELVIEDGAVRLLLEDAIGIALSRNLEIAVERFDREQALLGITASKGIFDLRAAADLSLAESDEPNATQLEGVPVLETDRRNANVTLNQLTPWGGDFQLGLNAFRSATNSLNQQLNPLYSADADFGFEQPLLRNFGRIPTARGIYLARLDSGISRENFENQVAGILQQVETAYWSLVEAREQLVVARDSLQLARDLHSRNEIQVEVGTLAPIELVQSEATIALREEDIITAEAALGDAGDELLRLLNLPDAMAAGYDVVPVTEPTTEEIDIDVEAAIATALAERTEVRTQRLAVERAEIDARFFANQKLPQADLRAGYGSSGLAGVGPVPVSEDEVRVLRTDLNDAFDTVFDRDFTGWSVGLFFSYPLQNRTAEANAAISELELDQAGTQLDQVELGIATEVRSAARRVRSAAQQIQSARATSRLQRRNLEAEQKRYENGMSDSFRIAQIQTDLTEALSREVTAVTNYRIALVDYYRAIGRLLEQKGVELVGPEDEEPPPGSDFSLFGWRPFR
jgi:outer membrane protein